MVIIKPTTTQDHRKNTYSFFAGRAIILQQKKRNYFHSTPCPRGTTAVNKIMNKIHNTNQQEPKIVISIQNRVIREQKTRA